MVPAAVYLSGRVVGFLLAPVAADQLVLVVDCRLDLAEANPLVPAAVYLSGQVADARSMLAAHGSSSDGMAATDQSNRTRGCRGAYPILTASDR